jgi:signal transduction histidine kinase
MKTNAFLIRLMICTLLAWIPLKDMDLRILNLRLDFLAILSHSTEIHQTASLSLMIFLVFLAVFCTSWIVMKSSILISSLTIGLGGLFICTLGFQIPLFTHGFYIPTANFGAAILITYLVFTGYRLALQETREWRNFQETETRRALEEMKSNFISLMSHDLKTPIAKISAMTDKLKREIPPSAAISETLQSLESSNLELKNYINRIIDLSRIESQDITLKLRSHDMNAVIENCIKRLQNKATVKNITLEKNLEPLFSFEFDEELIQQVISNILDNAIEYTPTSGQIWIRSYERHPNVCIEIEDNGPGIPAQYAASVFKKFNKSFQKTSKKGSGLGLYLSKYFIEKHGGQLRLKTEEGKGSLFYFELPITQKNSPKGPSV